MKAYAIQIRQGIYLTETMGRTNNLQECMWLKDKATAKLYIVNEDRWHRVIEIYIRKKQGQWVASME